jgi:hypothetical protein
VREQRDEWKRLSTEYVVRWTPTILIVDEDGEERYRIEGFLPAHDFLAHLSLGMAHTAFKRKEYLAAERLFRTAAARFPRSEAAAEALYWAGAAKYRATNDQQALTETATALKREYPDSLWAKKASVWES